MVKEDFVYYSFLWPQQFAGKMVDRTLGDHNMFMAQHIWNIVKENLWTTVSCGLRILQAKYLSGKIPWANKC